MSWWCPWRVRCVSPATRAGAMRRGVRPGPRRGAPGTLRGARRCPLTDASTGHGPIGRVRPGPEYERRTRRYQCDCGGPRRSLCILGAPVQVPGSTDITMPEALTESFCERCGTRYEFAAPTELSPMRRTRGLLSGLKNYILSQDALSDSVGDAMRSQEQLLAEKQLEAFHASFNFCIDCRQYTCLNCWHEDAGRCQSCVPMPGAPTLEERFAAATAIAAAEGTQPVATAPEAWPISDLEVEPEPVFVAEVEPEPLPEPEPVFVAEVEPEPLPEPEPMFVAELEPAPVFVAEVEPEPVFVAEVAPEPLPEPEPEPLPEPPRIPYRPVPPISDTFLHRPAPEPVAPPF